MFLMPSHRLRREIMTSMRTPVYGISAAAIAWFFLFPQPCLALTGAMLLQTVA
jgi:hypothetical protein